MYAVYISPATPKINVFNFHLGQAGYQITQLDHPIASKGQLDFIVYNPAVHRRPYRHSVELVQIQLEEDSGKSIHDKDNHR